MSIYNDISNLVASNSYQEILTKSGVAFKQAGDLLIFDYEIDADWNTPYPAICRGLVMRQDGSVVCSPMKKFWNSGESMSAKLDWNCTVAFEKMDGTMVNRWWDGNDWAVSTRYNFKDGLDSKMSDLHNTTWRELIAACLRTVDLSLQPKDETWTYEICSPFNRVVVKYDRSFAVLLSRRKTATGEELPIDGLSGECPRHNISSLDSALTYVNTFAGTDLEGVVCFDGQHRTKIKNASYVWWHHIRSAVGATWKNMLGVYFKGETSEFVSQFPAFKAHFDTIDLFMSETFSSAESLWKNISQAPTRKEFALLVNSSNSNMRPWLFNVYSTKYVSPKDWVMSLSESDRVRWAENAGLKSKIESIGMIGISE
jgi:hypothetical protein